ncbi:hypothetical protein LY76DRAFT_228641 [Colletotrichum caudatum]|nr:hypothetical protein LY76DRAFT_228641 [Colletotrichum caudatum]
MALSIPRLFIASIPTTCLLTLRIDGIIYLGTTLSLSPEMKSYHMVSNIGGSGRRWTLLQIHLWIAARCFSGWRRGIRRRPNSHKPPNINDGFSSHEQTPDTLTNFSCRTTAAEQSNIRSNRLHRNLYSIQSSDDGYLPPFLLRHQPMAKILLHGY